jgi:hypothetical protein
MRRIESFSKEVITTALEYWFEQPFHPMTKEHFVDWLETFEPIVAKRRAAQSTDRALRAMGEEAANCRPRRWAKVLRRVERAQARERKLY